MGSVGPVSVSVCAASTHQPLPVVKHGDKTHIVTFPGLEYEVVLDVPLASFDPVRRFMIVDMDVDSLGVGYGLSLYGAVQGSKAKFDHLREGKGAFRLKFASLQQSTGGSQSQQGSSGAGSSSSSVGLFDLTCWSAVEAQEPQPPNPEIDLHPSRPKEHTQQLPDGKKWFTASTLRSESGSQVALPKRGYGRSTRVSSLGTLRLYYETAPVLLLRQVLNRSLPQHAVILASAQQRPPQPQPPAPLSQHKPLLLPSSSQAQGNQQGGARLKRERGAESEGNRSVLPIDLTQSREESRPLRVNGRVAGENEVVVCDLTAGGPPSWKLQKK